MDGDQTPGILGVESPTRKSHTAGPLCAECPAGTYNQCLRFHGGSRPGAGNCRTLAPTGFLQLEVQANPHRMKPTPSTGRCSTERNRAGVTGRVPFRAALPAPPGRTTFHVVHGPPTPGRHEGETHRPPKKWQRCSSPPGSPALGCRQ